MAIEKFNRSAFLKTDYGMKNVSFGKTDDSVDPVEKNLSKIATKYDSYKVNDQVKTHSLGSSEPIPPQKYIKTDLDVKIEDSDGFTNFSSKDISANISGTISIEPEFIVKVFKDLEGVIDKAENAPDIDFEVRDFDKKRNQHVIKAKVNNILGPIDVGVKVKIGVDDDKLAIRVGGIGLKRGITYKQLTKLLVNQGLASPEKGRNDNGKKVLYINPTFLKTIDIPVKKDDAGNILQTARLESIDSNSENLKFAISDDGEITITLDNVGVIASSDIDGKNTAQVKPDVAEINFDFDVTEDGLEIEVKNGNIKTTADKETLGKVIKAEKTMSLVEENFGTSMSLGVSDLKAKVKIKNRTNNGEKTSTTSMELENASISVEDKTAGTSIKGNISTEKITTEKTVSLDKKGKPILDEEGKPKVTSKSSTPLEVNVDDLNVELTNEQKIIAENINYKDKSVNFTNLEGKVDIDGIKAEVEGDGSFGIADDKTATLKLDGKAKGSVKKETIDLAFNTAGKHQVIIKSNESDMNIGAVVEEGNVTANVDNSNPKSPKVKKEKGKNLNVDANIKKANFSADVKMAGMDVNAKVNEGGITLKAEINSDEETQDIILETDAKISATASGEDINGSINAKDGKVTFKDGKLTADVDNVVASGSFNKNNLSVEGKEVKGKIHAEVTTSKEKPAEIEITAEGHIDANLKVDGGKIGVDATAKKVTAKVNGKDLDIELNDINANTSINASKNPEKKTEIKVNTEAKTTKVELSDGDVTIKTIDSKSTGNLDIGGTFTSDLETGDVTVNIGKNNPEENKKGDINIVAENVVVNKGKVVDKKGELNLGIKTKADKTTVDIKDGDNIGISSEGAKTSVNLDHKVASVKAKGNDFNLDISGNGDIEIDLDKATYSGKVAPPKKGGNEPGEIEVNVKSKKSSDINVSLQKGGSVEVSSKSGIDGDVNFKEQIVSDFQNESGFGLEIDGGDVKVTVPDLELEKGSLDLKGTSLGLDGKGDFELNIKKTDNGDDLNISYDGKVGGETNIKDGFVSGDYSLDGKVNVSVKDKDPSIDVEGRVTADLETKEGAHATANLKGDEKNPINISIEDKKVNINMQNSGVIEVTHIDKLPIPKKDKAIVDILEGLQDKKVRITIDDVALNDNIESGTARIKTSEIETNYGDIKADFVFEKNGKMLELKNGYASIKPGEELFALFKEMKLGPFMLNTNASLEGNDFKIDGALEGNFTGIDYAKIDAIANIEVEDLGEKGKDYKLVLDLNDTEVLGFIKTSGHIKRQLAKKKVKTELVEVNGVQKLKISLGDIAQNLELTKGVNFTGAKIAGGKFHLNFEFNSVDNKVAKMSKEENTEGLEKFLNEEADFETISPEAISTAYSAFAEDKDIAKGSDLMLKVTNAYLEDTDHCTDLERGLRWIVNNDQADKKNIRDNISLKFVEKIGINTDEGKAKLAGLPTDILKQLAHNMDGQGIYPINISNKERGYANQIREIIGEKKNPVIMDKYNNLLKSMQLINMNPFK